MVALSVASLGRCRIVVLNLNSILEKSVRMFIALPPPLLQIPN